MRLFLTLFLVSVFSTLIVGQQLTMLTSLNTAINETSGLLFLNNRLITHNDSGGEPALYEIDTITGNITRKVTIANVQNNDWEDICHDGTHIFIGDFGNNNGNRTDLSIYKIEIGDYLFSPTDTIYAETISISYADQNDFTSSQYTTNYDAEAMICYQDSLYIFSKNWGNFRSNIYPCPKIPGSYSLEKSDSINTQCMVTGAAYDSTNNRVLLSGYTILPYVIEVELSQCNTLTITDFTRHLVEPDGSIQTEGVCWNSGNRFFLSSEDHFTGAATLHRLEIENTVSISEKAQAPIVAVYPNPVVNVLTIDCLNFESATILDVQGVLCKKSNMQHIPVGHLPAGVYHVKVKITGREEMVNRMFVKL